MIGRARTWMQENPATLALVALAVGVVGTLTVGVRGEATRRIVTKSPCLAAPDSRACAEIRQKVARAEPIRNPCVSYQRVTRTRGRACPKDFIGLQRRSEAQLQAISKKAQDLELGDVPAPTSPKGNVEEEPAAETPDGTKQPQKSPKSPPGPNPVESPAAVETPSEPITSGQTPETPETEETAPGLLSNPGGTVGELFCFVNKLGVRVCTE